eukprot:TRINITY_DN712_c0_g1_i1.p1 TRINITY_DN712_c0_g1~~TRINITY_DN712_c0_g1_i1.p1  ORF type:complete len:528 (-),score=163.00 TRINITY_DN712_c0_g1_i1:537-2084(-)
MALAFHKYPFLKELGLSEVNEGVVPSIKAPVESDKFLISRNPSTGEVIAKVKACSVEDYNFAMDRMEKSKVEWMKMPAPKRGEIVRQIGLRLREKIEPLGKLVSLEMGKILPEGIGEVQEGVDICEFAVGLSRSINGQVIPSERAEHVLLERYNPLGMVGVISAFNFPVAVAFWNLALSLICGNVNIWKGASSVCLTTMATAKLIQDVLRENGIDESIVTAIVGPGSTVGEAMIQDKRLSLVSFTGSTEIGRHVSEVVHSRFGTTILELGGNNAAVVCEDADLDLVVRGSVFGAVGTCGQRCTSLRRMLINENVYDEVVAKMLKAYENVTAKNIGDPLADGTLIGPLHTEQAVEDYLNGLEEIKKQGGKILCGGYKLDRPGNYVAPTIVEISHDAPIVQTEIFAPIMYVFKWKTFDEAMTLHNSVPQGLSSALFTKDMQKVFQWVGPVGSDCGLVNVNVGTSGAEIGGAFGGNKETGSGRESGSDAWRQYCRRSTCTINFGNELPLAQGIKFGSD